MQQIRDKVNIDRVDNWGVLLCKEAYIIKTHIPQLVV